PLEGEADPRGRARTDGPPREDEDHAHLPGDRVPRVRNPVAAVPLRDPARQVGRAVQGEGPQPHSTVTEASAAGAHPAVEPRYTRVGQLLPEGACAEALLATRSVDSAPSEGPYRREVAKPSHGGVPHASTLGSLPLGQPVDAELTTQGAPVRATHEESRMWEIHSSGSTGGPWRTADAAPTRSYPIAVPGRDFDTGTRGTSRTRFTLLRC